MQKLLPSPYRSQKGQVILVILLIIAVILTIGLSVVSRSITDIKISRQSQESARALWVAQGGLEKAISANSSIEKTEESGIDYSVLKQDVGGGAEFVFPQRIKANEAVTVWLIAPNEDGTLPSPLPAYSGPTGVTIGWGDSNQKPALETTVIYSSGGSYFARRYAFDSDAAAHQTRFEDAGGPVSIEGKNLSYSSGSINLTGMEKPILMKLRLLYNDDEEPVGIRRDSGGNFPLQGACFVSTASVQESSVSRKLEQCRLWPGTPAIFDFLLYSGGNLE